MSPHGNHVTKRKLDIPPSSPNGHTEQRTHSLRIQRKAESKSFMSPVPSTRLFAFPANLLAKVLIAAVDAERAGGGFRLFDYNLALPLPLRLSHVCSYLRLIVLDTPELWNTIDNDVFPSPKILDAFLTRSRNVSLDITITAEFLNIHRFKQILPCANRWRKLSLAGDDTCEDMFEQVLEEIRTLRAPNLTHLKIDTACEEIDVNSVSATFTGGTPSLLSLDLNTYTFLVPSDLRAVKSLSLYNPPGYTPSANYDEFCNVLKSMPCLIDLRINGEMATEWPSLRGVKPIPNLHLKSLRVSPSEDYDRHENIQESYLSTLLITLSTASLQYFSLTNLSDELFAFFIKSLRRGFFTFPNVRWLAWAVDLDETDEEDLALIAQSFPSVETLSLMYFSEDHTFLQFLSENPMALPRLCSVNIRDAKLRVLCDLVQSRLRVGRPIRDAWVEKRHAPEDDGDVKYLRKHIELKTGSFDGIPNWQFDWE